MRVSDVATDELVAVMVHGTSTDRFEDFYRREYVGLVDLARALTGDWAQAQDVVQEAMIVAFGRWDRLRGFDKPGAFARRVVLNRCRSLGRRPLAEGRALARMASRPDPVGDLPADASRFWAEVRKLPRRQRDCVALAYVDGFSMAEIAEVVGRSQDLRGSLGLESSGDDSRRGRVGSSSGRRQDGPVPSLERAL